MRASFKKYYYENNMFINYVLFGYGLFKRLCICCWSSRLYFKVFMSLCLDKDNNISKYARKFNAQSLFALIMFLVI